MPNSDALTQLSRALAARTAQARDVVVAIRVADARHLTGTLWRPDLLAASEQALPKRERFEVVLPGGAMSEARLVGRDSGTNVALLRIDRPVAAAPAGGAPAEAGCLVLAFGSDGRGGASARMGLVNLVGPEWHSRAGGRIDSRVALDIRLASFEEGGPAFDAEGRRLGITTFGPRGRVLVIPEATIEAVIPLLEQHGRVARGWLGVAFQRVAVPDQLQAQANQAAGLMVMAVAADGPAAKAGVMAGDIVLSVGGAPATGIRGVVPKLGADSVGRTADLRLLRSGTLVTVQAIIEARPVA